VPTTVAIASQSEELYSNAINCSTGAPASFPAVTTDLGTKSISNVVQWRLTGLSFTISAACGPPPPPTRIDFILQGKTADDTLVEVFIQTGAFSHSGTISFIYTNIKTILSIRYDGFLMDLDDFFPPP
jgi:hypothetical protein